jgi:hypothetical protein
MLGPNRIIRVKGSFKLSDTYNKEFHKMAQTFGMIAEYGESKEEPAKKPPSSTRQPEEGKVAHIEPEEKKLQV